jgi:hypothetical protein
VREEDKRPDDKTGNDRNLAKAFAGQADLIDDGGCEIQNEENSREKLSIIEH